MSAAASDVLGEDEEDKDIAKLKTLELLKTVRTQRSLGNPPAASLEKEEEGSVKLEELDDEDAVPVQGDTCDNDWAAEEDIDESDSEPIEMDPIDTLVDDEYIALEDDEGEGDDVVPVENVMENDNDSSEASQKRPRTQTAEVDAAQWVKECDKAYAVDENDKDVRQFEAYLAHIIYIIYRWAEDLRGDWFELPRKDREMVVSFYAIFKRAAVNPNNLLEIILQGIPLQTRKVLGKADLKATDLFDLPLIPDKCMHRLVYMDVATELRDEQICRVKKFKACSTFYKAAKPMVNLKEASRVSLYVGSSMRKAGSWHRIEHENAANQPESSREGMHYREISKSNVVTNFRMIGVWKNIYADDSYVTQDVDRWLVTMVEGLMMVYLGIYTEQNAATWRPDIVLHLHIT